MSKHALLLLVCVASPAQWLHIPAKNTPRAKDGKPDLAAAASRKPDGKPDLAGIWGTESPKYLANLAADFKPGEFPIQPWAEALTRERMTGIHASEESNANCLPQGVPRIDATPNPFKIVQESDLVVILYEAFGQFRQIYLDGRALPRTPTPHGSAIRSATGRVRRLSSKLVASTARPGSTRPAIPPPTPCM